MSPTLIPVVLLASACVDGPGTPVPDDLEMIYWSGDAQEQSCYQELPEPIIVRVLDEDAVPVAAQAVEFRVLEGGGWLQENTVMSDDGGFAAAHWTVGAPGAQVLEASATSAGGARQVARVTAAAQPVDVGLRSIPLTCRICNPQQPAISADHIVYPDMRDGRVDVYVYDLATEAERRVDRGFSPVIDGSRVVYFASADGRTDLYLYDLDGEVRRRITTDLADPSTAWYGPAISGDRIVWSDFRDMQEDVYLYSLATGSELRITSDPARQWEVAISGDRVVWADERRDPYRPEVYLYDVTSGTEQLLAEAFHPSISGGRVVYGRLVGAMGIHLYDLATRTEQRITTDASRPSHWTIAGDRIVWVDGRSGKPELYLYDLATQVERRLSAGLDSALGHTKPAVSGDRIVWEETRGEGPRLQVYDLRSACTPPASASDGRANAGSFRKVGHSLSKGAEATAGRRRVHESGSRVREPD